MDAWPPLSIGLKKRSPAARYRSHQAAEVRLLSFPDMQKSDKVPVFMTGMDTSWEKPAQIVTRGEARELKDQLLGKFENHGQTFRLFQTIKEALATYVDGPMGIGNLLPWAKVQNPNMAPEHLHYRIPAVADRAAHFGHCMSARITNRPLPLPVLAEAYS